MLLRECRKAGYNWLGLDISGNFIKGTVKEKCCIFWFPNKIFYLLNILFNIIRQPFSCIFTKMSEREKRIKC